MVPALGTTPVFSIGPIVGDGKITFEITYVGVPFPAFVFGLTPIATINWEGLQFSNGEQPVSFHTVEVEDILTSSSNLDGRQTNDNISVDRPDITVYIDRNTAVPSDCEIDVGETLVTRVMADDVYHVDQVNFQINFDSRFVQVNQITPEEFFSRNNGSPHDNGTRFDNGTGTIIFDYDRTPTPTDGDQTVIAEIEWEGRSAGRSPQSFSGNVNMFNGGDDIEAAPATTVITELDGCDLVVNPQQVTIFLDPSDLQLVQNGNAVRQEVKLRGVRNIDEVAFTIRFDEDLVQVVDSNGQPANEIEVGNLFNNRYLEEINRVNNQQGTIEFRVNADTNMRQDGTVAVIYWQGLEEGDGDMEFGFVELLDGPNGSIGDENITRENGTVEVEEGNNGGEEISGIVEAQGRPDHSGTKIYVYTQSCDSSIPSGTPTTTTNADGSFSIDDGQSYQCLKAYRAGHLVVQKSSPSGDLGYTWLPAGDVIKNNAVDFDDLVFVVNRYDNPAQNDPVADYNNNGKIDIFDVGLVANNYIKIGPWTRWSVTKAAKIHGEAMSN
ncbi:MAG: hypothetical protein GY869_21880 [Planctomycetes bacterium]|nr:hypothetical protein [Planctomycetota bacterium]